MPRRRSGLKYNFVMRDLIRDCHEYLIYSIIYLILPGACFCYTTSRERIAHMPDVVREITEGKGTGFFVFVDRDFATSDPLRAEWTTGREEVVRLTN